MVNELSVFKKQERGNTSDLELSGCLLVAVCVELGNDYSPEKPFCHSINGGSQHAAGATGRRIKVNHNRF
jgi:hypothetical protein